MAAHSVTKTNELPRRIPKLAIRNRIPESELVSQPSAEDRQSSSRESNISSDIDCALGSPLSWSSAAGQDVAEWRGSLGQRNRQSPTQDLCGATSDARNKGKSSKKKKHGGVQAFLSLKEPSTKAWEEFAQAEREKAKQRGGTVSSSQKLPDYVPKVNTKWDGMPEGASRKSIDSKGAEKTKRSASMSGSIKESRWGSFSERNSTRPNASSSSVDQVSGHRASSSLTAPHLQLEPLPELSPFGSTVDLGKYDASHSGEVERSSSSRGSADEKTPTTPPAEMDNVSGGIPGVDNSELRKNSKAINFSRPLPRSPDV